MARRALLLLALVALFLVGCNGGKDQGVTIQTGQGPSAADIDKQITDIQANTHMPDGAKRAQIAQLQTARARAAASTGK